MISKKVIWGVLALLVALALLAYWVGSAGAATAPTWVANEPSTGLVPVYTSTVGDVRIRTLEVTATSTDVSFSVWYYLGASWTKSHPQNGPAAADTVITIPAGVTKAFTFGAGVDALYLSSGTAFFAGE